MNAVILMTRLPHPGSTKTRLMPLLTPQQCASLHASFLKDYEASFSMLRGKAAFFTAYAPEHVSEAALRMLPAGTECFPQQGADLGQRMAHAMGHVLSLGFTKAVLVGSDIPHLQPGALIQTFEALDRHDLVFGPTLDGGYYLVGMTALQTPVFEPVSRWGSSTVLETACRQANLNGLTTAFVDKYRDIDTPEDLLRFHQEMRDPASRFPFFPAHTFAAIRQLFEGNPHEDLQSAN